MSVIITRELSKVYGAKQAVCDLNLAITRGSVFGFLGPNGSGKSTTVKMLLGLRSPSKGSAQVLGFDSSTESELIGQHVGYVPELGNLYPQLTVQESINLVKGLRPSWDDSYANHLLTIFELPDRQRVRKLSKGMQRQLALLLAMAPRPELLILDEPSSGLDPIKRQEFLQVLMDGVAETGQTVFFSSHNMIEGEQGQWIVTVEKGLDAVLAELRAMQPLVIETYDLSLEDIFVIYAGGDAKCAAH